ncbi:MAG: 8-oxo-dGTP diphosphatase [Halieaceae bacterium]|jgi:8-oxo-dGTP diphosphatase
MKEVHVAVGVILDSVNRILITRRGENAHQGGLWEFPGGKVESGETVRHALQRELQEELGITIGIASPLVQVHHDYGDKAVLLDVYVVQEFSGEPKGLEGQPLEWVTETQLKIFEFPKANALIVEAVAVLLADR